MSTSGTVTIYQISSVDDFDQELILTTQALPDLTDAQAFSVASGIATGLGVTLGGDELQISKTVTTTVDYTTDYTTGTFS